MDEASQAVVKPQGFLNPFPANEMKSYPVSQQVNSAKTEDAQLVEPIELRQAGTNLTLF